MKYLFSPLPSEGRGEEERKEKGRKKERKKKKKHVEEAEIPVFEELNEQNISLLQFH